MSLEAMYICVNANYKYDEYNLSKNCVMRGYNVIEL